MFNALKYSKVKYQYPHFSHQGIFPHRLAPPLEGKNPLRIIFIFFLYSEHR